MIQFFATGEPKGQPRPKAFARKFGDKWMARVYDSGTAENWKSQIAVAARAHIPGSPLAGPLRLTLEFTFPRPKSHYRGGKYSSELKHSAAEWHTGKPDMDNAAKAVMDCMTQLGFWHDDAQVASGFVSKRYGDRPGCHISVELMIEGDIYERQVTAALEFQFSK